MHIIRRSMARVVWRASNLYNMHDYRPNLVLDQNCHVLRGTNHFCHKLTATVFVAYTLFTKTVFNLFYGLS